jgi:RNA polymerase sigma-70 factor (ECF subfamily)
MENKALYQLSMDTQTPVTTMINTELKSIHEGAIRNLPEKYRTVFVMREIENMNVEETRACLAISVVNVKVRLNRAKTMLRKSLENYYRKEDILHFHLSRCNRMVEIVLNRISQV